MNLAPVPPVCQGMFSYSGPARLVYADGTAAEMERVNLIETVDDGFWQLSGAGTAAEALSDGRSPSERFELPSVRITIELVEPSSAF